MTLPTDDLLARVQQLRDRLIARYALWNAQEDVIKLTGGSVVTFDRSDFLEVTETAKLDLKDTTDLLRDIAAQLQTTQQELRSANFCEAHPPPHEVCPCCAAVEMDDRRRALEGQLQTAQQGLIESNAICACGCPDSEHEDYGEDGRSCDHDEHECIPTSRSVAAMLQDLRGQLQTAQQGIEKRIKAEVELAVAAERREIAFNIEENPNSTWTACTRLGIEIVNARLKDALKRAEQAEAQLQTAQEQEKPTMEQDLEHEIACALNRFSAENASNTPDWILAQFLLGCLAAWNQGVQQRETWYGRDARPNSGGIPASAPPSDLQARHQKDSV